MKTLLLIIAVFLFAAVPSARSVIFTFDQVGSTIYNEGQDSPWEFSYELTWDQLDPSEAPITDFHLRWPTYYGGYIEVIPPENWTIAPGGLYRPNYEANPGAREFTNVDGSLGGFTIYGKLPTLVWGSAYLTKEGQQVGTTVDVLLPAPEPGTLCLLAAGTLGLLRRKR